MTDERSLRWLGRILPLALLLVGCASKQMVESRNIGPGVSAPVEGISYFLPKKLLRVEVYSRSGTRQVPELDAKGQPVVDSATNRPVTRLESLRFASFAGPDAEVLLPDLRHQFVIVPKWDSASHDNLAVSLTKEGLLTSVAATATDERATIIQGILDVATMMATGMPVKSRAVIDSEVPRLIARFEFDPIDPVDLARVRTELAGFGIRISLTKQSDCPVATSGAACCTTCDSTQPGIYYRLPLPYRLSLAPAGLFRASPMPQGLPQPTPPGEWDYLERGTEWTVLLPNEAVCMYVPVNRANFVTSSTLLEFDRGMLTKVTTDKPSELVGFVKIPVDALSAIFAIPAELLTFRVQRTNETKNLNAAQEQAAAAETARLNAQVEALKARNALRAAEMNAPPAMD